VECIRGTRKTGYDILNEECQECEFKSECRESKGKKKEEPEEKALKIKNEVREDISIPEGELYNYCGCIAVINKVITEYKKAGLRKRKGYKDRKKEIKPEIKAMGKFPASDEKLNLLIDCAEYVFFGIK